MTIDEKPPEQLRIENAVRQALEMAATRIENYAANNVYRKAMKIGAKLIREMKPS